MPKELRTICDDCGSDDIERLSAGDESWDVCQDCRSVEHCTEKEVIVNEYGELVK